MSGRRVKDIKGGLALAIAIGMARASRPGMSGRRVKDIKGGLAHLARALAWHARGDRFESDILHKERLPLATRSFG